MFANKTEMMRGREVRLPVVRESQAESDGAPGSFPAVRRARCGKLAGRCSSATKGLGTRNGMLAPDKSFTDGGRRETTRRGHN